MSHLHSTSIRLPVLLTLTVGICLTVMACLFVMRAQDQQTRVVFQRDVDKVALDIATRLKGHFDMLLSIKGLYASSESVEREEFASFITKLDLSRRYPGFQTIQFVRVVPHAGLADFIGAVRRDISLQPGGYPHFSVHPKSTEDTHYVIEFCEPMIGNEAAFGLDLGTIPVHKKALELGRDIDAIVATEPIRLVQEAGNQAGFVARVPLYRNYMPIETLEQRRAALYGFAAIVFRVDNLMQEVVDSQLLPHMSIRITDAGYFNDTQNTAPLTQKPLFDSLRAYPEVAQTGKPIDRLTLNSALNIGERRWNLEAVAHDGRRYGRNTTALVLIAGSGVVISLLSASLLAVFRRRRILAERLRMALDEQRAFQDNAVVGILLIVERNVQRCNRGLEEMMRYEAGTIVGMPSRLFFKSKEEYLATGRLAYAAIDQGDHWESETELVRQDGTTIWCMIHGKAVDPRDSAKGAVWVIHDISDRKAAEAALVEARNNLQRSLTEVEQQKSHVQTAHDDLAAVLSKLQQARANLIFSEKMASLGSLVAGIAHELNTPIGNSLLAATALSDRVVEFEAVALAGAFKRSLLTEHLADTRTACALLAGSLHKAAHLIASFKQVAVDQTSGERRHFDLRSVLEDTLATYAVQLRRGNCEASLDAADALMLDSYPGSIGQIISNLIGNALLHAFEGRTNARIKVSARKMDADWVEVVFADNGIGMQADVLHRVFDPFFTTKMGQGGSGLGMNIVYNIVTGMLGGRITIESVPGDGCTIRIAMPKLAPMRDAVARENLF